jgi:hypothetical protein
MGGLGQQFKTHARYAVVIEPAVFGVNDTIFTGITTAVGDIWAWRDRRVGSCVSAFSRIRFLEFHLGIERNGAGLEKHRLAEAHCVKPEASDSGGEVFVDLHRAILSPATRAIKAARK